MDVSVPSISIEELDEKSREPLPEAPDFPASLTEDDICALIYTSGTTGSPKGAMLTHKNLVRNVEQFTARIIFKPEDKVLCVLPMFHCYGMTTIVHGSLYAHSTEYQRNHRRHSRRDRQSRPRQGRCTPPYTDRHLGRRPYPDR